MTAPMTRPEDSPSLRQGRRRARWRAWWPLALVLVLGTVLLLQRWRVLGLPDPVEVLLRIVFAMAVAGWVIGDFLRFLVWWFRTRHES